MIRKIFIRVVLVFGMVLPLRLAAYPPAPDVTLKGLVRDEYGWVLRDEGAEVVVRQQTRVIGRAPIVNDVNFGFNYRVNLPVDSNRTVDPYRPGALLVSSDYSVEIHVGGAVYSPIETLSGALPAPEPGTVITLDLSLGTDSDGDTLPDDWELWQLQMAGLFPGDPGYHLGQLGVPGDFDADGRSDYSEFLAGTFATFSNSIFRLAALRFESSALVEFDYFAVRDKSYRLEVTSDFLTWIAVEAVLDSPLNSSVGAWTSDQT